MRIRHCFTEETVQEFADNLLPPGLSDVWLMAPQFPQLD